MISIDRVNSASDFKAYCRYLITKKVTPSEVTWEDVNSDLFAQKLDLELAQKADQIFVQRDFADFVKIISLVNESVLSQEAKVFTLVKGCYKSKWGLLYRILFRLTYENRSLLSLKSDDDIRLINLLCQGVKRDIHKMHAFVRFKKNSSLRPFVTDYIAWYCPEHYIVRQAVQFFIDRFADKSWGICTPYESVVWKNNKLTYTKGISLDEFKQYNIIDDWDALWKDYYRSIYNPARLNTKTMLKELPRKYWQALPESEIISELIGETAQLLEKAKSKQWGEAKALKASDLSTLSKSLSICSTCGLCKKTKAPLKGLYLNRSNSRNTLMIVVDHPDYLELSRHEATFESAEYNRGYMKERLGTLLPDWEEIYALKVDIYFTYLLKSSLKPISSKKNESIHACWPWLKAEIEILKPNVLFSIGVESAITLLGYRPKLSKAKDKLMKTSFCHKTLCSLSSPRIFYSRKDNNQNSESLRHSFKRALSLAYNS